MIKNMQVYKPSSDDTQALFAHGLKNEIMMEIEELDVSTLQDVIRNNPSTPPLETQWLRMGFVSPTSFGNAVFYNLGDTFALCVGIQERLCPSSVITRLAEQKGQEVAKRENRTLYKRELAQFKEAAVAELLPKSHVRLKMVMVYFTPTYMLVGTGSVKEADDVVAFLRQSFNDAGFVFSVRPFSFNTTTNWMSGLVRDGVDETQRFKPARAIALKGKGTVRIKDIDMKGEEVLVHMDDKTVIQLEVEHVPKDTPDATLMFDLTDQMGIKRIRFSDVIFSGADIEVDSAETAKFDCNVSLVIPTLVQMLDHLAHTLTLSDARYEAKLLDGESDPSKSGGEFADLGELAGLDPADEFRQFTASNDTYDPDDDEL